MTSPLDALADALHSAAAFNAAAESAPEAVVWCDASSDFVSILPALRLRMPGLLTFGNYDTAIRSGPALWLRAAATRQVHGVVWPPGEPPFVYIPGHGREALRDAKDCPAQLAPLVWFAVAGSFFGQPTQSRDWTLRGFLAAQGSSVAIDVPEDRATRAALARAASRLFLEPIAALKGKRWDAAALDGLLVENPVSDMLTWMDGALTPDADPARFEAFAALATKQFSFDPRKRTRQDAAARLVRKEKAWAKVWNRFAEAASGYDEVVRLLGVEEPQADLLSIPETYPTENAKREAALRTTLLGLKDKSVADATKTVRDMEAAHAWRRSTVWAKRGQAKLALTLEHLMVLASAVPLPSHDALSMANAYAAGAWTADAAALSALDVAKSAEDRDAVVAAIRALYLPWLDVNAAALQGLAATGKVPFAQPEAAPKASQGLAWLFVDGLRMDLAQRLCGLLRSRGAKVETSWRWSGFPTITSTCKPLASPGAGLLAAGTGEGLMPTFEGKATTKPVLEKAIEHAGWSCSTTLLGTEPLWIEGRSIDRAGEDNGADFLPLLPAIIEDIAALAIRLARQGRQVRIVTDHGFLIAPGGLSKADLSVHLTVPQEKAKRVARLKEGAPTTFDRLPWTWDPTVLLATAPGARAFYSGVEYAHGGVSPQECVLPVLDVTADATAAKLEVSVRWKGLIARVRAEGGAGLMADIRVGSDTGGPSALINLPRALDDAGEVGLAIDDAHEGKSLCLVLYRAEASTEMVAKLLINSGD